VRVRVYCVRQWRGDNASMGEWVLLIPYACRPPRVALELCKDSCSNGVGVVCHGAVDVDSSVSSFPSEGGGVCYCSCPLSAKSE